MAVYGIGLIIKLLQELEKQDYDPLGVRPRDLRRVMESEFSGDLRRLLDTTDAFTEQAPKKRKKRRSAYNKRYSACFKKLAPKYKKKSGGWKKDGFKRCAKAARKCAKK